MRAIVHAVGAAALFLAGRLTTGASPQAREEDVVLVRANTENLTHYWSGIGHGMSICS